MISPEGMASYFLKEEGGGGGGGGRVTPNLGKF